MTLTFGVFLWAAVHFFGRVLPDLRAKLGKAGFPIIAALVVFSIYLMVIGYGDINNTIYWGRSPMMVGINNLLILAAVYLFIISKTKSRVKSFVRHPQLTAVKLWAVAHLLVNGDTAAFILFGGLLAWAIVSVILINRNGKPDLPDNPFHLFKEILYIAIAIVIYGAIAGLHSYLGYPTFG